MSRKESAVRRARSLLRSYCPCRLAPAVLSQAYERLLPELRRTRPSTPAVHASTGQVALPAPTPRHKLLNPNLISVYFHNLQNPFSRSNS